jgi:hypothetical protein
MTSGFEKLMNSGVVQPQSFILLQAIKDFVSLSIIQDTLKHTSFPSGEKLQYPTVNPGEVKPGANMMGTSAGSLYPIYGSL